MSDHPNILFLFSDQHRGDWMPYDESTFQQIRAQKIPVHMPNIRRLMDQGCTFTNNMSNSPLCVPARACLASGMQYDRCRVYNNDYCYPLNQKTFYRVLRDGGYEVCGVGKFDLHKPIFYWGTDGWIDQLADLGFTDAIDSEGKYDLLWSSFYEPQGPYAKFLTDNGLLQEHARDYILRYLDANDVRPTPLPEYAYADNWVGKNSIEKLRKISSGAKPWFLMVNFSGPHNPWDVTERMKEAWKDVTFPLPSSWKGDKDELNAVRQNYAAMLENIDRNIGLILDELKKTGQYENTVVIYSADHGEMMGDHNRYMKSVPYRGSVHIPLVVSGPGVEHGKICNEMVQLHDIAATITDFAGYKMPPETDSCSLKALACGLTDEPIRNYQAIALYNSLKFGKDYPGYEDLMDRQKKKNDQAYIQEFCKVLGLTETHASMSKFGYSKDWKCVMNKQYKLIEFDDAPPELYDLQADPDELVNIAEGNEQLIAEMKELYQMRSIEN